MRYAIGAALIAAFTTSEALACACGCGLFDVSTSSMLPTHEGGMAFLEYDFMDQNRNWSNSSRGLPADNDDKNLKSQFITAGGEYMFNREWGIEASMPYTVRHFTTTDDDTGDIVRNNHSAFGDVRLQGVYSGFSPDMSSGVTFGTKLPTGDFSYKGFDRDTSIGSGSTDLLLGAYHMGNLAASWNWFANGLLDQPALTSDHYRPGTEVDAVSGVYYNGWHIGGVKIAPVAQIVGSVRAKDNGLAADPTDSGYERLLLSPGLEVDTGKFTVYGDVELPVWQHVRGDQMVAPAYFKLVLSRSF